MGVDQIVVLVLQWHENPIFISISYWCLPFQKSGESETLLHKIIMLYSSSFVLQYSLRFPLSFLGVVYPSHCKLFIKHGACTRPILTPSFPLPTNKMKSDNQRKKKKKLFQQCRQVFHLLWIYSESFDIDFFSVTTGHKRYVAFAHLPSAYWLYDWKSCFKVSGCIKVYDG